MKSVMSHNFSQVPAVQQPRSSFQRNHGVKTTFDSGYLVPVFWDLALPGDTMHLRMSAFARVATPVHPIMDNLFLDSFFFAVPIRLVWDNFQKFMGEQIDPGDSTDFLVPQMVAPVGGHLVGSLSDYLGLPTQVAGYTHSSLWHRAYNLIWNSWHRDQNLQDSLVVDRDDGPDTSTDYVIKRRGRRHDYFTSALPWPQKGDSVSLPLGTSAPVYGNLQNSGATGRQAWQIYNTTDGAVQFGDFGKTPGATTVFGNMTGLAAGDTAGSPFAMATQAQYTTLGSNFIPPYADLNNATAATINALRQAFQLQVLLERDARGGTRFTEIIRSHFGVVSSDARLQRPEYLGGGSSPINISPIAQTSSTDVTSPQGNLAAMGTVSISGHGFNKSFEEHTLLLGMVMVRADQNYQQGLNRHFSLLTKYDFYWPALANIGEQAILNKEIYMQASPANDAANAAAFGYQERYAELRYKPSQITGQFRSTFATSLDNWHLAVEYGSLPVLGDTFIQDAPPVDRVVAVPAEPEFLFDGYFDYKCARRLPMYGVPGFGGRF